MCYSPPTQCYSRSNQQFDDVQLIMHSINDACLIARVTFEDNLEVHLGCGGNTSTSSLPSHLLPSSPLLTPPHPDLP